MKLLELEDSLAAAETKSNNLGTEWATKAR